MSKLFYLITVILSFADKQQIDNCDNLADGKYKVSFDPSFQMYEDYSIQIEKDNYKEYRKNGDSVKGKVKRISDCLVKFDPERSTKDSMTALNKLLLNSFGDPCIELLESKNDTIKFRTTYTGNLHVTINGGIFLRLK